MHIALHCSLDPGLRGDDGGVVAAPPHRLALILNEGLTPLR